MVLPILFIIEFYYSNPNMSPLRQSDFILQRIGFEHTNRASARHVLRYGPTTVGRGPLADYQARTEYAGRNHCVIRVEDDRVLVKDNQASLNIQVCL